MVTFTHCLFVLFTQIVFPGAPQGHAAGNWVYLISVDGTDCPILEPCPFSTTWFSHKFKGAAIKYEVALDMQGNIVWISPPYRGSINDKTIFCQGLTHLIPQGCLVIVDQGYPSTNKLAPLSEDDTFEVVLFKKRVRR